MWAYILTPVGFKDQMGLCSTFVGFLIRFCQVINQQRCPACLIHNATFRTNQRRKKKNQIVRQTGVLSVLGCGNMEPPEAPPTAPLSLLTDGGVVVLLELQTSSADGGTHDEMQPKWTSASDKREVLSKCLIPIRHDRSQRSGVTPPSSPSHLRLQPGWWRSPPA